MPQKADTWGAAKATGCDVPQEQAARRHCRRHRRLAEQRESVIDEEHLMQDHVHQASDRAAAQLNVATVWLRAGRKRRAGRAAVEAVSFSRELSQHVEAIMILRSAGQLEQARELRQITLESSWPGVGRGRLLELLRD